MAVHKQYYEDRDRERLMRMARAELDLNKVTLRLKDVTDELARVRAELALVRKENAELLVELVKLKPVDGLIMSGDLLSLQDELGGTNEEA